MSDYQKKGVQMFEYIKKPLLVFGLSLSASMFISPVALADEASSSTALTLAARDKFLEQNALEPKASMLTLEKPEATDIPNGAKLVTAPDGTRFIQPKHGSPYCVKGCDFAVDCRNNEPPPPANMQWKCNNKPRFCVGNCYLTKTE